MHKQFIINAKFEDSNVVDVSCRIRLQFGLTDVLDKLKISKSLIT